MLKATTTAIIATIRTCSLTVILNGVGGGLGKGVDKGVGDGNGKNGSVFVK